METTGRPAAGDLLAIPVAAFGIWLAAGALVDLAVAATEIMWTPATWWNSQGRTWWDDYATRLIGASMGLAAGVLLVRWRHAIPRWLVAGSPPVAGDRA